MHVIYSGPLVALIDAAERKIEVRIDTSEIPEDPEPDYLEKYIDRMEVQLRPYLDLGYKLHREFDEDDSET